MANRRPSDSWLVIAAVIGLVMFFLAGSNPEAAEENLRETEERRTGLDRNEAEQKAAAFLESRFGYRPEYRFAGVQSRKQLNGYLQKTGRMESYQRQYADATPLEYFLVELGNRDGTPRYVVEVHKQSGDILGWRKIETEHPLAGERGEAAAREFLASRGYDLNVWKPDRTVASRPHEFVFSNRNAAVGEAVPRVHVAVEESGIAEFRTDFTVPASYLRWMERQDLTAGLLSILNLLANLGMCVAAIVICVLYKHTVPFSRGLLLTLAFLLCNTLLYLNMYPAYRVMSTGMPGGPLSSLVATLFSQAMAMGMAAFVYLSLVTGDALWRNAGRPLWERWRESDYGLRVLQAAGRGYLFCLFIMGLQQGMYWIGQRYFGVWSVSDPLFSTQNLFWPLLYPLLAWAAAISEEAIYRLFGIILFKKLFRLTFVAALVSSMIWAVGHTAYPIYPAYTRFVEVTILGLVFAYILLKYGFITAVFAHASLDSVLTGINLAITGHSSAWFWGVFYILLPAMIGVLVYGIHRWRKPMVPLPRSNV